MKKMILIFTLAICFTVFFSACGDGTQVNTREMILFVGPHQVDCTGGPQGKCLQVKYSAEDSEWVNFGNVIQGFEWEEGYEYELSVKFIETRPKNYDYIIPSFELIEVLEKTKIE